MNESALRAGWWHRPRRRTNVEALTPMSAALCLVFLAAACQGGDVQSARLAPSKTSAVMACMLAAQSTAGATSALLASCATEVPKIVSAGLDQITIDGVLAGTAGSADPGIRTACFAGAGKRAIAAVETMGYGVIMDGQSERVHVVQQDNVTTFRRDGTSESARIALAPSAKADTTTAKPSACTMMIVHALTVASLCADQQWTGGGCAALRARMQYCGDPTRLMVDPDLGFACQPTVDADAVTSAAAGACEGRSGAEGACAPEASVNGWLRDPGGICASAHALVSADKETCVVPVSVKGPRSEADITAVILWGKTTSGGPIFTAGAVTSP